MIKLVILDFDDTLSMTEEATFYLENAAALRLGFQPMGREAHRKNWGQPVEQAILERIPGISADAFMKELTDMLPEYVRDGKVDAIPYENIRTLDVLRRSNYKLAVLTTRTYGEVKHLLEDSHPLHSRIAEFYHKDNSPYRKPDPRVFDQILKRFGITQREAVYVGDTVSDARCAKGAGLYFVASLESGLRSEADFAGTGTDAVIPSFRDLPETVLKLNQPLE